MEDRLRLTREEVLRKGFLTLDESIKALNYMGIEGVSEHIIRLYKTRGLIVKSKFGPPSDRRAKYQTYFSKNDIFAIVEIRNRIESGELLEDIIYEVRSMTKDKIIFRSLERKVLRQSKRVLPKLRAILIKNNGTSNDEQDVIEYLKLLDTYTEEEKIFNLKNLGAKIDEVYKQKLEEFLKLKKGQMTIY